MVNINTNIYGFLASELKKLSIDPPDPNFNQVVSIPSVPEIPIGLQLSPALSQAFSRSLTLHLKSLIFLRAANRSFDRYVSAISAGDTPSATLQLEAFLFFLAKYKAEITSAIGAKQILIERLLIEGMPRGKYDVQAMNEVQSTVATQGFPQSILDLLHGAGLGVIEIQQLRDSILAFNPTPNSVDIIDLFLNLDPGIAFSSFQDNTPL